MVICMVVAGCTSAGGLYSIVALNTTITPRGEYEKKRKKDGRGAERGGEGRGGGRGGQGLLSRD